MVGLVLVSHSKRLAEAAARLARGVGGGVVPIAFAGGAGPDGEELGTDADEIMEAIKKVDAGDGVLVLMDLGSAILGARMAAEMLADDVPDIRLCPAPLVEGAVAAAVGIAAGADIAAAYAEAGSAMTAKTREVGDGGETPDPVPELPEFIPADALHYCFAIGDPNGMHARPAAKLAAAVGGFAVEARIRNRTVLSPYVNAKSLNRIALSNIRRGDVSELAVWGPQAREALEAAKKLVAGELRGGEVDADSAPGFDAKGEGASGPATLSPGMAEGTLFVYAPVPPLQEKKAENPGAEMERLDAAIDETRRELASRMADATGPRRDVLEAQLSLLGDAEILRDVRNAIARTSRDAAGAYQARMAALAASYRAVSGNPYLKERAADVEGIARVVLDRLSGRPRVDSSAFGDVIVWGGEISPSQMGEWPPGRLKGILATAAGPTSHTAVLAREMGIPALTGCVLPRGAATGDRILLDADRREVAVNPDSGEEERFRAGRKKWEDAAARDLRDGQGKAVSLDGVEVPVLANAGGVAAAARALANGADGIGLLRTEFLFLDRAAPPSEEEQTERMAAMIRLFAGKPVTVRTLDAGGDKPMPWLGLPAEANPFLGVRGIRISMRRPDAFRTQIRAILRAGTGCDLAIMIPMVDTAAEVAFFRDIVDECRGELVAAGVSHAWPVKRGIMVETPAAALQASLLAPMVDFFSIGSNDLAQYVMCAERGAKELAHLQDGMQPPVLGMIGMICAAAAGAGIEVSVCGEMAADPVAARALLGLGVGRLSVNANAVGAIKRVVRESDIASLRTLSRDAVAMDSAEKARSRFAR